ncbi:phenylalanine--tRNA ligase subunit alpha [Halobacteriales archaeon SW_7_68_16]|nr:MAG: phenylalanine--tRNA ligase subunit alpha [Halobacteriales archaeon SW_7_68_16]
MRLPPAQVAVLEAASATDPKTVEQLADETDRPVPTIAGAVADLDDEGLVGIDEETTRRATPTDEGHEYVADGLPEGRLLRAALDAGADETPVALGDLLDSAGLDGPLVDIALANYSRKYGTIESGSVAVDGTPAPDDDVETATLAALAGDPEADVDADPVDRLVDRGLVVVDEETTRRVTLTDDGVTALMEGVEDAGVGRITPELLSSGDCEDVDLRAYDVTADADEVTGGRTHVLRDTVERVKDVLVGMGFREMEGPHADAQFWINDCLFMPQDHPARTHWDQFALAEPSEIDHLPDDLVERVRSAHLEGVGADGEGYHSPWAESVARGVDLRGHTTSLSMRYLSGEAVGDLEPPERYFSVEKVYRNDTLDATHLLEFFQIEGWVMAEDLSVRDLMGTFAEFYEQFGITDLQFKPTYNPYTEPSFELFGEHPTTGELIEIGNSGIFREEVLEPLGVDCDVMAWGLALGRLLMLTHGFEDIRDVHGTLCDLDLLRDAEVVY